MSETESEHNLDSELDSSEDAGSLADLQLDHRNQQLVEVKFPANISAYLERRELIRDEESVPCESELAEKVMTNYIIAKRILSYVSWQDKVLCKHVCTTWRSAINSLAKERLNPVDFVYDLGKKVFSEFIESENFYNEPLAVLTFINIPALSLSMECEDLSSIITDICNPVCEDTSHNVLDFIHKYVCGPKSCMLTTVVSGMSYLPAPQSVTKQYSPNLPFRKSPFYSGIFIPTIPEVQFHVLNIKQWLDSPIDLKKDLFDEVDKLAEHRIFKGALIFITEKYILRTVQDVMLLNYFKQVQPDIPYALGGCLIQETLYEKGDMKELIEFNNLEEDYISKNLISIALFTVPKNRDESQREKCNFDMFSVIIERSEWSKDKIKKAINEFAKQVPRFEHSVALKLSCVGRDKKHTVEQELFRDAFPQTPIIGCYGNGELGINHPERDNGDSCPRLKRPKADPAKRTIMYSYSTVFVYIGWGKITSEPETSKKN